MRSRDQYAKLESSYELAVKNHLERQFAEARERLDREWEAVIKQWEDIESQRSELEETVS